MNIDALAIIKSVIKCVYERIITSVFKFLACPDMSMQLCVSVFIVSLSVHVRVDFRAF